MERGIIKSYDRGSGAGTIGRTGDTDVTFNATRIIGNRNDINQGDRVWFEMETMKNSHSAINIRKCM